jgi:hypothetical protein
MKEIFIDTKEIENYFWSRLVKLGYAPEKAELEDLADICFDYLIELGIIEDVEEY